MREILFRGKTGSGEWVEGFYSPVNLPIFGTMGHFINEGGYRAIEILPDTIGQYTGLEDKNGVKIFEGDILNIAITRTYGDSCGEVVKKWRTAVEYFNGAFAIKDTGETYPIAEYIYPGAPCTYRSEFEVIGNIHDNPELR